MRLGNVWYRSLLCQGSRFHAISLVASHAAILLYMAYADFVTVDECAAVAAGVYHWDTGDYSLYSVNPPLSKMASAVPVLLLDPIRAPGPSPRNPYLRCEWEHGNSFARTNALHFRAIIFVARIWSIICSVLAAAIIYRWSVILVDHNCALLAIGAWCFGPTVLAHGHLATADMSSAAVAILSAYAYWSFLNTRCMRLAVLAGVCLGLAQATKTTMILLYPVYLAIHTWHIAGLLSACQIRNAIASIGYFAFIIFFSVLVLNASYEFDGTLSSINGQCFQSKLFTDAYALEPMPNTDREDAEEAHTTQVRLPILLPEFYLKGIDVQRRDYEGYKIQHNYMDGEWAVGGRWYYYIYAISVKEPLGGLVMLLIAIFRTPGFIRRCQYPIAVILIIAVPLTILISASAHTLLNKHLRYLLPCYPFACMAIGTCMDNQSKAVSFRNITIIVLSSLSVASVVRSLPLALSYSNEAHFGTRGKERSLSGSNYDIGQDLWRLRDWLTAHGDGRPLMLAYYNYTDPHIAGIEYTIPPHILREHNGAKAFGSFSHCLEPGLYAISLRYLQGSSGTPLSGESLPRTLVPLMGYAYFQDCTPIAVVGDTIYVYDISPSDASRLRAKYSSAPLPDP